MFLGCYTQRHNFIFLLKYQTRFCICNMLHTQDTQVAYPRLYFLVLLKLGIGRLAFKCIYIWLVMLRKLRKSILTDIINHRLWYFDKIGVSQDQDAIFIFFLMIYSSTIITMILQKKHTSKIVWWQCFRKSYSCSLLCKNIKPLEKVVSTKL